MVRDEVHGYPVQLAKVQGPPLREETLERPRLLDWLRVKVHGRVTLLLADAGYGKTTLLADFARRHRIRTLWYRLDDDDRDWVSFLHHLVAAGREYEPEFAPRTWSLLGETGISGPSRETVLEALLSELPTIATGGAVLILDDFHVVDEATDVRHIVRELLARGPERMSYVFASRRMPQLPLARLRAIGEVAELGTDDLRFDRAETAKLFNETYGRQLEPDVLAELSDRTEGWIASLQMVQAALRDRSQAEIRRFVRSMTGADQELYDYLAEEVVGDLEPEVQRFLMETSILLVVTAEFGEVASGRDPLDVARLTSVAERLTLLSRISGGPRTHRRYHPLVRQFLEARLRSLDGDVAVAALHRRVADFAVGIDWRTAAHHYREAGDTDSVLAVVSGAVSTILGNGQYALAEGFIRPIPAEDRPPSFDLILSRVDMQQGDFESAIAASQAVLDNASIEPVQRDHALLNLATLYQNLGDGDRALGFADRITAESSNTYMRDIGTAIRLVIESGRDGSLDIAVRHLTHMAATQIESNVHHYGVTMLNLAIAALAQDDHDAALANSRAAVEALSTTGGHIELVSAIGALSRGLLRLGDTEGAAAVVADSLRAGERETIVEYSAAIDSYGDEALADSLIAASRRLTNLTGILASQRRWYLVRYATRRHLFDDAERLVVESDGGVTFWDYAGESFRLVTIAHLRAAEGSAEAAASADLALRQANAQRAHRFSRIAELLAAFVSGDGFDSTLEAIGATRPWHVTYIADLVVTRLDELGEPALHTVRSAAALHPDRWRGALRREIARSDLNLGPATLLEEIGRKSDVAVLRSVARQHARRSKGAADLGRRLARRTAERIYVEDLGRVHVRVGGTLVAGSSIRRKVLGLLCFLLTRPGMSGTRDQVLDALWPDLEPTVAVNSLNQTLYFLRRVFEEDYKEDLSPGYVHHDSEVIWLDPELVDSRSRTTSLFIQSIDAPAGPDQVDHLAELYVGRFALDFEYEDWSIAFRDNLHASYLEVIERAVMDDFAVGHYDRAIRVARRLLTVEPTAENVEATLLRLYRVTGAHAAAAEQYAHYSSVLRDLGIEPPPLESM